MFLFIFKFSKILWDQRHTKTLIAVSTVRGMTKTDEKENDFHLFVQVQRLALASSWFLSIWTPTFRPNIQPTPPPDWDENIWNMLLYFRFFTNANMWFCKFNFFLTNVHMCFHKYKQIVSQMPTCVFPNTNVSQSHTFIFTNTSKLFHIYVNMCLHKNKQILSQIQMFSQIKTQQNCFTYM